SSRRCCQADRQKCRQDPFPYSPHLFPPRLYDLFNIIVSDMWLCKNFVKNDLCALCLHAESIFFRIISRRENVFPAVNEHFHGRDIRQDLHAPELLHPPVPEASPARYSVFRLIIKPHLEPSVPVLKDQLFSHYGAEGIIPYSRNVRLICLIPIPLQSAFCRRGRAFPLIQLAYRSLAHNAVSYEHFPRECKAVLPSFPDRQVSVLIAVRHSHPPDQDPSAVLRLEALRCIIVKSIVPQPVVRQAVLSEYIPVHKE